MTTIAKRAVAVGAVLALLGAGSYAVAGGGKKSVRESLESYQEVPAVSSNAVGEFSARIANDDASIDYTLTYAGVTGAATQAHVHFGQRGVNGGVSFFLCSNLGNGPAGTQPCPPAGGTVTGTIDATDVVGPAAQGIAAGELAEIIAAIRAGVAYANVHTTTFPGGELRAQLNDGGGRSDD